MIRNVVAAMTGIAVTIVFVMAIQALGHTLYPAPAGLDTKDSQAMADYVSTLPIPALLFPMFSYFIGTFIGTALACRIGEMRPIGFAAIVGLLVLTGTISNLLVIPHPLWFSIFALMGIVVSAWLGMQLAGRPAHES
jgi:hypothetical protein